MSDMPSVKTGSWISFGTAARPKTAVVCSVYDNSGSGDIEVVYLDDRDRAINEDMRWQDGHWEFAISGPCGGYADKNSRLNTSVAQLRRGQY